MQWKPILLLFGLFFLCAKVLYAQQEGNVNTAKQNAQALADKLSNPVASMISVPFQNNTDYGIGQYNGSKNTLNIQPVVPFQLSKNLNLITRYIVPVIDQRDVLGENTHESGLSDATVSAFFTSAHPKNGLIWALGPAFLLPIATDHLLGTQKWGVGPTALVLKQGKGNTFGFLANQIWSFAGSSSRQDVNQLFVQPFYSRSFKSGASLGANMELTQNWQASTTLVFPNPIVSAITKIGSQPVQLTVGPRIPLAGPDAIKPKFGIRAVISLVFAQ